jgi:hypothetical protein
LIPKERSAPWPWCHVASLCLASVASLSGIPGRHWRRCRDTHRPITDCGGLQGLGGDTTIYYYLVLSTSTGSLLPSSGSLIELATADVIKVAQAPDALDARAAPHKESTSMVGLIEIDRCAAEQRLVSKFMANLCLIQSSLC